MIQNEVWVERFRPESLTEVIGHDKTIARLQDWVDDDSMPNLLLHGPAGTGKTATAVAFAKDKYGDRWSSNLIEMNASDERGIDVVRDRIKSLAKQSPAGDFGYKIIYLDEADSLTKDAQAALRRIMEQYADNTRFILSCNYPNKLIDPIQSRCISLPFKRLDNHQVKQLLERICEKANVEYEDEAIDSIVDYTSGDARRAVHTLQTSVDEGVLTTDIIDVVSPTVPQDKIDEMIENAASANMEEAQETLIYDIVPEVTDYSKFASSLMNAIKYNDTIEDDVRWYIISRLGETERNIQEGSNPHVQLGSFLAQIPVARNASIPNYE